MHLAPRKRTLVLCALFSCAATAAVAESNPGERLRITFQPDHTVTGSLVGSDAHTVSIRTEDRGVVQINRSDILRTDRFAGSRRNWGVGLLTGAAAGALVGGLATADTDDRWVSDGFVVMYYSMIGSLTGAAVGAFFKSETWESVPTSDLSVHVGRGPNGGASLSLSFRF